MTLLFLIYDLPYVWRVFAWRGGVLAKIYILFW